LQVLRDPNRFCSTKKNSLGGPILAHCTT